MKKFTFLIVLILAGSITFAEVPTVIKPNTKATITRQQIVAGGQHNMDNPSSTVVLNFEGLGNEDPILQFYNGGLSGGGFSGTNYGVYFSSNALSLIDFDNGGTGNFANEPSPNTAMFFLEGDAAIMNFPAGFTTGFSFYYTANVGAGTVSVYDGLDGTGTLLGTQVLPVNLDLNNCTGDPTGDFCHWDPVGISFAGTAKSISFGGVANHCIFDDVTFGSATPGNQCIPTLSQWGLIILALLFLAAELVFLRRRQYSFAVAGGAEVSEKRTSLFNLRSYFMILAVLLGIAAVVFAVEVMMSVSIPSRDIVGAVISSSVLAFILQLFNTFRKE